jgi:hypothetical protein
MKIAIQNPPFAEMTRTQICQHFNISYPTLRKATEPVKDYIESETGKVLRGEKLKLAFTIVHNYLLFSSLKQIFIEEKDTKKPQKLTKKALKRLIED